MPLQAWARAVFPDAAPAEAEVLLWNAIFAATRIDAPDPVAAWATHNAALMARRRMLTERRFAALQFRGPGTDLTVGLAEGHAWMGGQVQGPERRGRQPQHPPPRRSFTTPHAARTHGHVTATKPLSHQGTLIRDIRVRFKNGLIIKATASSGQEVLQRMIDTDAGARRLGEVALVPASSPISASGLLFLNTLFDENAAGHIALGQAYRKCFVDGDTLDEATYRPWRQQQPDPRGLDDRLSTGRCRRDRRCRRRTPGDARRRMGNLNRLRPIPSKSGSDP